MPIQAAVGIGTVLLLLDNKAAVEKQRVASDAIIRAVADGLDINNAEEVRLVIEKSREI